MSRAARRGDVEPAESARGRPDVASWLAPRVIAWQRSLGRHDLPWQRTRDPYRIWISEIMLQQTQVAAVMRYYARFMERFADVRALAAADVDQVLELWAGLGYYSRARNLHACAKRVVDEHGGQFPRDAAALAELPGIGRSTAAAIAAFAFGQKAAILDGNVKRVLARVFGIEGHVGERTVEQRLWRLAESLLPDDGIEAYTQGLMDLGATVCVPRRPYCERCPLAAECVARSTGRTAELPAARPRRVVPQRQTAMLVLRDGDRVLLERRPAAGIWGGLWSLPQLSADEAPERIVEQVAARFGLRVHAVEPLAPFTHAFTHFRLQVFAWLVDVQEPGGAAGSNARAAHDAAGTRWLPAERIADAGVPQPVKQLLLRLLAPRLL